MGKRVTALLLLGAAAATSSEAQIRASEAASVSQTVDGTVIRIEYSRPLMRGRAPGPDGIFHHEHMWTPGANWATTIDLNRPITLNGHAVAAGRYSLWTEPAAGTWKVHLHPNPRLFHTAAPKPAEMALSFEVTPARSPESVEALTFDFPEVSQTGATLRFRWAEVVIPFEIKVTPGRKAVVMTEAQAAPYVGSWTMQFLNEVNEKSPEMRMQVLVSNGSLRGVIDGPTPFVLEFIPTDEPHKFLPAFLADGQIFDVETATPVVFEIVNGRATRWYTIPVEGIGDEPWMWARRP